MDLVVTVGGVSGRERGEGKNVKENTVYRKRTYSIAGKHREK